MKTIKNRIMGLDHILTGSITKRFGPCGKKGCRCAQDKRNWHGPYHIWTRKENGKTITKSLSAAQANRCTKAIRNMRELRAQIEKWKRASLKAIEKWPESRG
jgi:hypothetical protein